MLKSKFHFCSPAFFENKNQVNSLSCVNISGYSIKGLKSILMLFSLIMFSLGVSITHANADNISCTNLSVASDGNGGYVTDYAIIDIIENTCSISSSSAASSVDPSFDLAGYNDDGKFVTIPRLYEDGNYRFISTPTTTNYSQTCVGAGCSASQQPQSVICDPTVSACSISWSYEDKFKRVNTISYVVPQEADEANFSITNISVTIADLTAQQAVASTTLKVDEAFSVFTPVTAINNVATLTYALDANLPNGLSFSTSTGEISGTPTQAIDSTTFTVTVYDNSSNVQSDTATFSLTVEKADQVISFDQPNDQTFSPGQTVELSATGGASGLGITFASGDEAICTVTDSTVTLVAGGICEITAGQTSNDNYNAANDDTKTFEIAKAAQAITFTKPGNVIFSTSQTVSLTASGGASSQNVIFTSNSETICTVTGSTVTMVIAGTCSITAKQAADAQYLAANDVTQTFEIAKAGQSISFTKPDNQTFTPAGTVTLVASGGASGEDIVFASNDDAICTVTGSTATMVIAGTCSITASQAGDNQYLVADNVTQTFAIGKADQVISFTKPANQTFVPDGPVSLVATGGDSGQAVTFTSSDDSVCLINGTQALMKKAGECSITALQAGDDRYVVPDEVTQTFTIGKATQAITIAASTLSMEISETSVVSFSGGTGAGSVTFTITAGAGICSIDNATVTGVAEGLCTITATKAEGDSYLSTSDSLNIAVAKATTSLAISASMTDPRQGEVVTYTATITAPVTPAGTVNFSDNGTLICADVNVSSFVATCDYAFKSAGSHSVSAAYSGDDDTVGSASTSIKITVDKTVEKTKKLVTSFMNNRANRMASTAPSLSGFVTGSNNAGGGDAGHLQMNANSQGYNVSFSTSRSKLLSSIAQNRNKNSFASKAGNASMSFNQFTTANKNIIHGNDNAIGQQNGDLDIDISDSEFDTQSRVGTYDVWTQLFGSRASQGESETSSWVSYLGTHYFVAKNTLVGFLGQFDWSEEVNSSAKSKANGRGWMVGPYVSGKVEDQNLFYEARALWGRSTNEISPDGSYKDQFATSRWLASGGLSGQYVNNEFTLKPSATVSYFEETQEAYTDSLNNEIDSQTVSMGEIRFGPSLSRKVLSNDRQVETMLGVSGVYNFGMSNNGAGPSGPLGDDTLRARFDAGVSFTDLTGITFQAAGFYDGVGVNDFSSYGGSVKVIVPLN